jgi:hypothetical protein
MRELMLHVIESIAMAAHQDLSQPMNVAIAAQAATWKHPIPSPVAQRAAWKLPLPSALPTDDKIHHNLDSVDSSSATLVIAPTLMDLPKRGEEPRRRIRNIRGDVMLFMATIAHPSLTRSLSMMSTTRWSTCTPPLIVSLFFIY